MLSPLASVPAYFALRVLAAVLLLKLSASFLTVTDFTIFTQFMLFVSLLNLAAVAGMQNGIIRQAAAATDPQELGTVRSAAFVIWAAAVPILIIAVTMLSGTISNILVGTRSHWATVVTLALLATLAGPAQIWCSLLSGRKRVANSLAAQAGGLITSTVLAASMIVRGNAVAAVMGFACGPFVTMILAGIFASRLPIRKTPQHSLRSQFGALLRYSAAFATTAGFSSLILFSLRSLYREEFGSVALGYWMAANRISDMATQLIGLFLIQYFVPHFAATEDETARRSLVLRCWAAGVAVAVVGLIIFSFGSSFLVPIFLSRAYLPAVPVIQFYLLGDILRVGVSIAMFSAFASGRPAGFAAIEIATLTLLTAIMVAFVSMGEIRAPQFAYPAAYAGAVTIIALTLLVRQKRNSRR